MNSTKVSFSDKELALLNEKDFWIERKILSDKLMELLNSVKESIRLTPLFNQIAWLDGTDLTNGKITRGENYLSFPWMVLDFPRLISGDNLLLYRTMIWWGNGCSSSLVVQGGYLNEAKKSLVNQLPDLLSQHILFATATDAWVHNPNDDSNLLMSEITAEKFPEQNYIKLMKKIPMNELENLPEISAANFELLAKILTRS